MKKLLESVKEIIALLTKIDQNIDKLSKQPNKSYYYKDELPYKITKPAEKPIQQKTYSTISQRHVTAQEYQALDDLYFCLVDKGHHPDHYENVMREILTKWPDLYEILNRVVKAKEEASSKPVYNKYYN